MINVEINSHPKAKKYPYIAQFTKEDTGYYYIVLFTGKDEYDVTHGVVLLNPWNIVSDNAVTFDEKMFTPFVGTLTISNE